MPGVGVEPTTANNVSILRFLLWGVFLTPQKLPRHKQAAFNCFDPNSKVFLFCCKQPREGKGSRTLVICLEGRGTNLYTIPSGAGFPQLLA